ncbi:substrate-binding periplasmic protein [Azospirillum halopraeferens]|uniref:substrate-binding periplasmic protein n=1 Tax=Azospirillum halopraeferens TaxID=34010 RepID=UPI000401DC4C|nr:transporter substrate-binding domain-containing protein [Azospirillum halopraeferens]
MFIQLSRAARRTLAAIAVLAAVVATAPASADGLKVAYVEFPPFSHTEDGRPKGSLIDLFDAIARDAGLTYTAESAPARRIFTGIPDGSFDVFLGIRTPAEFEGTTLTSKEPLGTLELRAWGIGKVPTIKAKEDLIGMTLVVQTGFSYGGWRPWMGDPVNHVDLVEARTPEQALALLRAGRAPVLLQYAQLMDQVLAAGGAVPDLVSSVVSAPEIYIVLSKKTPGAEALMARLDASVAKLKASGAIR